MIMYRVFLWTFPPQIRHVFNNPVLFVLGVLFLGRCVFLPEFLVIILLLLPGLRVPLVHFVDDLPETHTDTHKHRSSE